MGCVVSQENAGENFLDAHNSSVSEKPNIQNTNGETTPVLPMASTIKMIHTHQIANTINSLCKHGLIDLECPGCELESFVCMHPRSCYKSSVDFVWTSCDYCGRWDEIMFHCVSEHKNQPIHGFDFCLDCGLRYYHLFDSNKTNLESLLLSNKHQFLKNLYYSTKILKTLSFINEENDEYYRKKDKQYGETSCKSRHLKQNLQDILTNLDLNTEKENEKTEMADITRAMNKSFTTIDVSVYTNGYHPTKINWDEIYRNVMKQIEIDQKSQPDLNQKLIIKSIIIYNDVFGVITNGSDLLNALKSCSNGELILLSNIEYMTKEETEKVLILKEKGFLDEKLNYFKLCVYNFDIEQTIKYYEKDSFCIDYAIGRCGLYSSGNEKFGTRGCEKRNRYQCQFKHDKCIYDKQIEAKNKAQARDGLRLCQYVVYLKSKENRTPLKNIRNLKNKNNDHRYQFHHLDFRQNMQDLKSMYGENEIQSRSLLYANYGMLTKMLITTTTDCLFSEKCFQRSIEFCERNDFALRWYSELLEDDLANNDMCKVILENAVNIAPNSIACHQRYGAFLYNRDEFELSSDYYQRSFALSGDQNNFLLYMCGLCLYQNSQYSKAYIKFEQTLMNEFKLKMNNDPKKKAVLSKSTTRWCKDYYHNCWINKFSIFKDSNIDEKEEEEEKVKYYYDDFNIAEYSCAMQKYEDVLKLIIRYLRFGCGDGFAHYDPTPLAKIIIEIIGMRKRDLFFKKFDISLLSNNIHNNNNNNMHLLVFDSEITFASQNNIEWKQYISCKVSKIVNDNNVHVRGNLNNISNERFEFGIIGFPRNLRKDKDIYLMIQRLNDEYKKYTNINLLKLARDVIHSNICMYYVHCEKNNYYICQDTPNQLNYASKMANSIKDLNIKSNMNQIDICVEYSNSQLQQIEDEKDNINEKQESAFYFRVYCNDNLVEGEGISDDKLVQDMMDEMTMTTMDQIDYDYYPFIAINSTNYRLHLFPQ